MMLLILSCDCGAHNMNASQTAEFRPAFIVLLGKTTAQDADKRAAR
jgi:hypothetical protein